MENLNLGEIEKAVKGKLILGRPDAVIKSVSTDSRKVTNYDLFFPIIGENHDAHDFLPQVIAAGCMNIIVSNPEKLKNIDGSEMINVILVDDTKKALQNLASYYMSTLNIKKIAVTGSVGKTSTRDMLYYICSEKYKTGKNINNFNNAIGVPLTILGFDENIEVAIVEMGMSNFGEINMLADMVRPDIGVITNIGVSHIESLGSREGILKAKTEITNYFSEKNVLVINQSCDLLQKENFHGKYKIKTVGIDKKNEYVVSNICDFGEEGIKFVLIWNNKNYEIRLFVPGAHNAINAALAIAACKELDISVEEAIKGLQKLELTGKRLSVKEANGMKVIDDTYNACPDSMKSAIKTLANTKGKRKIAILGDMFELGKDSNLFHSEVGDYAGENNIDILIAIGEEAKYIAEGGKKKLKENQVLYFKNKEEFFKNVNNIILSGDTILVKGSRGMAMEEIVDKIINE